MVYVESMKKKNSVLKLLQYTYQRPEWMENRELNNIEIHGVKLRVKQKKKQRQGFSRGSSYKNRLVKKRSKHITNVLKTVVYLPYDGAMHYII